MEKIPLIIQLLRKNRVAGNIQEDRHRIPAIPINTIAWSEIARKKLSGLLISLDHVHVALPLIKAAAQKGRGREDDPGQQKNNRTDDPKRIRLQYLPAF